MSGKHQSGTSIPAATKAPSGYEEVPEDTGPPTGKELVKADSSFFESAGDLVKGDGQTQQKTPWIGLFGKKTKTGRDALVAAGVEEEQFYLSDAAGPMRVKPFQYHLLKATRYYTKQNKDGQNIAAAKTNPEKDVRGSKWAEHLIALVLVSVKDTNGTLRLIPATWSCRSGVCKALSKAIELTSPTGAAFNAASWGARSAAHAIAAQARFPGGRFLVTAWGTTETTKTPNAEGETFDYNLGHSTIGVTSVEGVKAFNDITSAEGIAKLISPATQSWAWRCAQLDKLIQGGAK